MRVIISGGGTGGHVYPAIAIANELKRQVNNIEILFVGAQGKLEMEKVPLAGYAIEGLWISGFQRKWTTKNILFPVKLVSSLLKAGRIIGQFKPNVVIGVGGYASGPILKRAAMRNIPCLIQEQNSYPGVTNRLLAKHVDKICVAFTGLERFFPKSKIVLTGNPVRKDLIRLDGKREEARRYFELDSKKKTILVFGGSLGAKTLNEAVAKQETFFEQQEDVQIIWQIGKLYWDQFRKTKVSKLPNVMARPYIDRMDLAYAAADMVVCRAGALTISELCIAGKPAVLVPSPNVAENHQQKNARALSDSQAAVLVEDDRISDVFEETVVKIIRNKKYMELLKENILKKAKPKAVEHIVEEIKKMIYT